MPNLFVPCICTNLFSTLGHSNLHKDWNELRKLVHVISFLVAKGFQCRVVTNLYALISSIPFNYSRFGIRGTATSRILLKEKVDSKSQQSLVQNTWLTRSLKTETGNCIN